MIEGEGRFAAASDATTGQIVVISTVSPFGSRQNVGSMLPTAMAWSAVATITAPVAFTACSRIASCASRELLNTPGSGPSSRIEPART